MRGDQGEIGGDGGRSGRRSGEIAHLGEEDVHRDTRLEALQRLDGVGKVVVLEELLANGEHLRQSRVISGNRGSSVAIKWLLVVWRSWELIGRSRGDGAHRRGGEVEEELAADGAPGVGK